MHYILIGGRSTLTIETVIKKKIAKSSVDKFSTVFSFTDNISTIPKDTGRMILLEDAVDKEHYRQNILDFVGLATVKFPTTRLFILVSNLDFGKTLQSDIYSPYIVVVYMPKVTTAKIFDLITCTHTAVQEKYGVANAVDEEYEDLVQTIKEPNKKEETKTEPKKVKAGMFSMFGRNKGKQQQEEEQLQLEESTREGGFSSETLAIGTDGIDLEPEDVGFNFHAGSQVQKDDTPTFEQPITATEREHERIEEEPAKTTELFETIEEEDAWSPQTDGNPFTSAVNPQPETIDLSAVTFEEPQEEIPNTEPHNEKPVESYEEEPVPQAQQIMDVAEFDEQEYRKNLEQHMTSDVTLVYVDNLDTLSENKQNIILDTVPSIDDDFFGGIREPVVPTPEQPVIQEQVKQPEEPQFQHESLFGSTEEGNVQDELELHAETSLKTTSKLQEVEDVKVTTPNLQGVDIDESLEAVKTQDFNKERQPRTKKGVSETNIIIVTGDRHSGVTSTALQLARLHARSRDVLYVDLDTKRKGSLVWLGLEEVSTEITEAASEGVKNLRNPTMLDVLVTFLNSYNMHALLTTFGVGVTEEEIIRTQKTLTVQNRFSTIVIDCPIENLHLLTELIQYSTVLITSTSILRGNLSMLTELTTMEDKISGRLLLNLYKNSSYVLTGNVDYQTFQTNMLYLRNLFAFYEDIYDWTSLGVIGSTHNYKDWYMNI